MRRQLPQKAGLVEISKMLIYYACASKDIVKIEKPRWKRFSQVCVGFTSETDRLIAHSQHPPP